MKTISGVGIAAVSLLLTGGAYAADLRMPRKAAPLMPYAYNWTGFYAGLNAGYAWTDGSGTFTNAGATGPVSGSGSGFIGGGQLGYNWQTGSWVLGLETDIQYSAAKGTTTGTAGAMSFTGDNKVPWFGTIRGRFGYAWDRTLVYATGGAAYGRTELTGVSSTTGAFTDARNFWTFTVGGGLEQALAGRWTARIEYLYVGSPSPVPAPPNTTNVDGTISTHIVRGGVNYRF